MPNSHKPETGPDAAAQAGVQVIRRSPRADTYVGTAQALIAAGFITAEQIPKLGTHMASYLPDGRRAGTGTAKGAYNLEGFRRVFPRAKGRYQVVVTVSGEEQNRRRAEAFEAARPAPSNVIPFPMERSKARPVVMQGRVIPMADLRAAIENDSRIAQGAVSVAFKVVLERICKHLERGHA